MYKAFTKRFLDIIIALSVIIFLLPFFIIIYIQYWQKPTFSLIRSRHCTLFALQYTQKLEKPVIQYKKEKL